MGCISTEDSQNFPERLPALKTGFGSLRGDGAPRPFRAFAPRGASRSVGREPPDASRPPAPHSIQQNPGDWRM